MVTAIWKPKETSYFWKLSPLAAIFTWTLCKKIYEQASYCCCSSLSCSFFFSFLFWFRSEKLLFIGTRLENFAWNGVTLCRRLLFTCSIALCDDMMNDKWMVKFRSFCSDGVSKCNYNFSLVFLECICLLPAVPFRAR